MDLADPNPVSSLEALPSHPRDGCPASSRAPSVDGQWLVMMHPRNNLPQNGAPPMHAWRAKVAWARMPAGPAWSLCTSLGLARCATRVLFANLGITEALLSPMFPILSDLNPLQWRMPYRWVL